MPLVLDEWKGEQFKKLLNTTLDKKMTVIGINLANELKIETTKQDNKDGDSPSKAGDPPAKVTGRLSASFTYVYDQAKKTLRVGTNVLYGKFLELGTVKMSARPFLRPVFRKNWNKIKQILSSKGQA